MIEQLRYIFAFDSASPLLFTQMYFWVFLAIVYTLYALIRRQRLHLRNAFLMLVSWFFYYKTSGAFLALLVTLTLLNWAIALLPKRRWILWLSVIADLAALAYFKYTYFAVDVFNSLFSANVTVTEKIILPVGISFYSFQVISYIVDVYRGHVKPVRNLLDFGFYVSFFPQLVAGPIVRATEFVPQLYKPFHLSRRWFGIAVFWILNGLIKKIILSDYLAVNLIDRVFDNPMLFTGFENLTALFCYSLQVYADFSGYTDIAIGVAMLMGFYLPRNFDSPYKSQNPQEFWRRWHQSLSRWLKSYVYIPLGGNRTILGFHVSKLWASNWNSFLTMLIGGLWHGASWNFVIWGALNGVGMIINKLWRHLKQLIGEGLMHLRGYEAAMKRYRGSLTQRTLTALDSAVSILLTFTFITFTRLFFRASSNLDPATANAEAWKTAKQMMGQILGAWNSEIIPDFLYEYRIVVGLFVAGMLIHWLPERWKRWYRIRFAMLPIPVMVAAVVLVVMLVYQFITADMQPFIYFQF